MIVRARLLIASTLVVMGTWLLGTLWWYDRLSTWSSLALGVLVPVALVFGFMALSSWAGKRSALVAAFDVRDGAFLSAPAHLQVATHAAPSLALLMFLAGSPLRQLRTGDLAFAVPTLLAIMVAVLVRTPTVMASFRNRPRIELRPNGLALFGHINTYVVPWDAITVGPYPWVRPSTRGWAVNRVSVVVQPDLLRRGGLARLRPRARNVPLPPFVTTHPAFVAAAINHYLFHPQHREAIGTPREYTRLCQALAPPEVS